MVNRSSRQTTAWSGETAKHLRKLDRHRAFIRLPGIDRVHPAAVISGPPALHVLAEQAGNRVEASEEALHHAALEGYALLERPAPGRVPCQIPPDAQRIEFDPHLIAPWLAAREMPGPGLREAEFSGSERLQVPVWMHRLPFALEGDVQGVLVVHLTFNSEFPSFLHKPLFAHRRHIEHDDAGVEV